MRTVALGALALATGCNQIFGLDPVVLTDATQIDGPPDARLPTVKLSGITPQLDVNGVTTGQAAFVAIAPPPSVAYGDIGGPLVDTTYTADAEVPVGYDFADHPMPWRLVYTLEGGVPHEVHWKPSSVHPGHAVELQLTPADREPVPSAASTFGLKATNAPTTWFAPRVYTTNAWTLTPSPAIDSIDTTKVIANYGGNFTFPIAGIKRKPDPVKDYEVLLEYADTGTCWLANKTAAFRINLTDGTSVDATPPTFQLDTKPGGLHSISTPMDLAIRIDLAGPNGVTDLNAIDAHQLITYGPAGGIPLHHHTEAGVPLPVPIGILLARCTNGTSTLPSFGYPSLVALATIGTLQYATPVLALDGGPSVRNGAEVSIVQTPVAYSMAFTTVAMPIMPTIDTMPVAITTATTVAIPAGGATASLDFMLAGTTPMVDLYEATLYRVDSTALIPVREFTFTERPLLFDRDQGLPAGTKFVFQIRAIKGASAEVANADFRLWGATQALATTFTQTFTLAP